MAQEIHSKKQFPTSDEFYKRILTDRNISSCHVVIVYLDSMLNKYMEKRISAWREISKGGDIPWHRVYFFKYKDKIIWDREKRLCTIDEMISCRNNIMDSFKIISYNILNDKSLNTRIGDIVSYLLSTDADIICLQEVSDDFINVIKSNDILQKYELAITDLKSNNIVILSKFTINQISLIQLNFHKQAIKITISDKNDMDVDIVGIHLTSDYKSRADDKRREQLSIILNQLNKSSQNIIIGDFNMTTNTIPLLDNEFIDSYGSDMTYTYDPQTNTLAKLNTSSGNPERFDRIYYSKKTFYQTQYKVRNELMCSDHYPIECIFTETESEESQITTPDNKKTSMMLIINNPEIDKIRRKYDIGIDRWMAHLNIYFGFIPRIDFDTSYYKIKNILIDKYFGKTLIFDHMESLDQTKYKMLCLMPNEPTKKILIDIRQTVDLILGLKSEPFNPHISLGRFHDDSWRSIKSITHEMKLDRIYFSEYGTETYVEPRRCICDKIIRTKNQTIEMLSNILGEKIMIGGSTIFENSTEFENSTDNIGSDLDLEIITKFEKKITVNKFRKLLMFSGEAFSVDCIENQHSVYLKIKLFDNQMIDLHIVDGHMLQSMVEASQIIKNIIIKLDKLELFRTVLWEIKKRFKNLQIYGQTYGYFNGICITIMLCHLFIKNKEILNESIDNIIIIFCKTFSEWPHPTPIFIDNIINSVKSDDTAASKLIRIHSVTPPYENILRTITKSTFNITMNALQNNLQCITLSYPLLLTLGIKSNDENTFDQMIRYVDSEILNIILRYEAVGSDIRPISGWQTKINPNESYMFNGYLKFGITSSTLINKLEKINNCMGMLFPHQLFRYKVMPIVLK